MLIGIWYEVVDCIINWLETSSADYVTVVTQLRRGTVQSDEIQATMPPLEEGATPTKDTTPTRPLSELSPIVEEGDIISAATSAPPSLAAPPLRRPSKPSPKLREAGDILLTSLMVTPTELEEQEAKELEELLGDLTYRYSQRPRRLAKALYYWFLSHFEYVVFLMVVLTIIQSGSFISFIYAALLMLWGVLSIPWPSKRFWLSLMFFTMVVLVIKYIYQFILVTVLDNEGDINYLFTAEFTIDALLAWLFGVRSASSYFSNAILNLLLLMSVVFHRSLLKVSRLRTVGNYCVTVGVWVVEKFDRAGLGRQCCVCYT